jgi:hypothetical protein
MDAQDVARIRTQVRLALLATLGLLGGLDDNLPDTRANVIVKLALKGTADQLDHAYQQLTAALDVLDTRPRK